MCWNTTPNSDWAFRTGRTVPGPVWPVRLGCTSSGRHNFLIRSPNWTFYICISIVLMRSTQWWSPIVNLTKLSRLVWPVYMTGLTSSPRLSSKLGICQFGVSTYAPLFLGKAYVPRNISLSQTALKQWEAPVRQSHLCRQWCKNSINHISWYCSTIVSSFW